MNKQKRRTTADRFRDAFRGVWHCAKAEHNMRVHLSAAGLAIFLAVQLGLTRTELALLSLTIGAVISMETMNTAVERLCDYVEPKYSRLIGIVKDLAAGAVVLSALGAAGVGCFLFLRPTLWDTLCALFTSPSKLAFLVIYLAAAGFFVRGKGEKGSEEVKK